MSKKDKENTIEDNSLALKQNPDVIERIEQQIIDLSNGYKRQQFEVIQNPSGV